MDPRKKEQDLSLLQKLGKDRISRVGQTHVKLFSSRLSVWNYQCSGEIFHLVRLSGGNLRQDRHPHLRAGHCGRGTGTTQVLRGGRRGVSGHTGPL